MIFRLCSIGRSRLHLIVVLIVVLAVHIALLTDDFMPRIRPDLYDSHVPSLSIHLIGEGTALTQVSQQPVVQSETINLNVNNLTITSDGTTTAQSSSNAANAGPDAQDGQVNLNYQLAEIQGADVMLGKFNLNLMVKAGKYESRALWNVGTWRGEVFSSGDADSTFRPKHFIQEGENELHAKLYGSVQDQLSIVWNLRNLVVQSLSQSHPNYEQTWDVLVQIGSGTHQIHWKFEPMDDLILPAGRFRAAKVAGTIDQDEVTKINIWYAVDFDCVPVRLEKRDAGGHVQDIKISTMLEKGISFR